jgi:two-component system sensor histidine kinase EvgS
MLPMHEFFMSKFLRLLLATGVLMLASLTGCVLSAEQVPRTPEHGQLAQERPVLRAVYSDFFPYGFTAPDGSAQGYSIDVLRQLAVTAGYDLHFLAAQNPRQILEMLEQGEADLSPLMALTAEDTAAGLATAALGSYALSVYMRRDHSPTELQGLAGKRVGVVAGSLTPAAKDQIRFAQIVEYPTLDALLLPVLRAELDAVVAVSETFDARLRMNFIEDKLLRLEPALVVIPYGIIVRRDVPQVHAALERAINLTATPAALAPLHAHWFGRDRSILQHPWFGNVAMMFGGIGLAFVSLSIYAVRLRRSSARLVVEHGADQLLIDALDKMRASIVIFDSDMKAVHWNSGFEERFPALVPVLARGGTLEQTCAVSFHTGVFVCARDALQIDEFAGAMVARVAAGHTEHQLVQCPAGDTFDLGMFRLGFRHFAAIWVDVTELHHQQARITEQSKELARKNEQLLAFSAMAAHDLKAPLIQQSALMDFILEDMSCAGLSLPADVSTHFATFGDLSRRMNGLVGDLLDYAKAESAEAEAECFAPDARLQDIVALAATGPDIDVVIQPGMPAVHVAPASFDMVMRNLIGNAAKHHDQVRGRISVRAYRQHDQVLIEVEDDGPGIATAQHARIFEPFTRLTRVEGTGLGLALVKKTVVAWGGEINMRNAGQRGSVFTFSLPAGGKTGPPPVLLHSCAPADRPLAAKVLLRAQQQPDTQSRIA